jgi:hypothetical protein
MVENRQETIMATNSLLRDRKRNPPFRTAKTKGKTEIREVRYNHATVHDSFIVDAK